MKGIAQKPLFGFQCSFDASTSPMYAFPKRKKEKNAFDVVKRSQQVVEVHLNSFIVPSRNGDEIPVKQHLKFMKDTDSSWRPSTIRPDTIRPWRKKSHVLAIYCLKI
ncbi:hypothetical protein AVEN_37652-1 [Araneus ventricosus]|uniref:Uncharacterized protein n=1 Tax=Araneus ventricosus TaxID=182803 RepID=A0A4Y2WRH5_ARAVE|nr:hypothetical protein AVEN_37652-1 [Araneus ventricosus]